MILQLAMLIGELLGIEMQSETNEDLIEETNLHPTRTCNKYASSLVHLGDWRDTVINLPRLLP